MMENGTFPLPFSILHSPFSLIPILILAAGLRLYRLGHQSLWSDECNALHSWQAMAGLPAGQRLAWLARGLPLHDFLMGFWVALGTSEFILRLPSALFGILTVLVTYHLGAVLFDAPTGLVAALLVAPSPFQIWYAQEAGPYALLMLMSTLSVLSFVKCLQEDRTAWWWAWLESTGLAVMTFRPAVYLLLFQGLFLALSWRPYGKRFVQRLVQPAVMLPSLLALGAALPLAARSAAYFHRALTTPQTVFYNLRSVPLSALPYTFFAFSAGFSVGPSVADLHLPDLVGQLRLHLGAILLYGSVFATLFGLGIKRLATDRGRLLFLGLYLAVPVALMLALALVTGHAYNVRYVAPALIPYLLILVQGLAPEGGWGMGEGGKGKGEREDWMTENGRGNFPFSILHSPFSIFHLPFSIFHLPHPALSSRWFMGLFLSSLLFAGALHAYYFNPKYARVDARGIARTIEVGEQPGDVILLSFYAESGAVHCYYRGALPAVAFSRREAESAIEAELQKVAAHRRVWLISVQPWAPGRQEVFPPRLAEKYAIVTRWDFAGARLFLLAK